MAEQPVTDADPTQPGSEPLDVLIVGAGLSGIGAARHLQERCADQRYAILEAREAIGGTWDLFRYPGIRSDSDMYTLGYRFKPWTDAKAIADGPAILRYVREAAEEAGIPARIRFRRRAVAASWSSAEACWSVRVERVDSGDVETWRTRFLYLCSGYYRYSAGYRPEFAGESDFAGTLVHPQNWPDGLDYAGRRVVVIGSGATAVTLVPAMAATAAHVTMLQRSPSYVVTRPATDTIAQALRKVLPERLAYAATRWKNLAIGGFYFRLARRRPAQMRRRIIDMAALQLGPGCDAGTHFAPRYDPWDQRVCLVPDGDLFREVRAGRVSVVTDTIERFTPTGIRLASGRELPADIVVVATGLQMEMLGGMSLSVDGRPVRAAESMVYKGMMLADVPNLALTFGYTNASWTLKADLTAGYVCRLLRHMARRGARTVVPRRDPSVEPRPFLSFTSGYVRRADDLLPRQGSRKPWQVYQSYVRDLLTIRFGRLDDGVLSFGERAAP